MVITLARQYPIQTTLANHGSRDARKSAGPAWLRALAAAGPWLRWPAGRCRTSGSSHAGAHGPGGSGSSHPSPVRARPARRGAVAGRNRAGGGRFRRLAASLLVFAVLGTALPSPAAAQTVISLISNTGQSNGDSGGLHAFDQAQAFTTGANAAGYTLTGVDIDFNAYSGTDSYTVSIWTEVSGSPGVSVDNLTSPSSLTDTALNSYTTSGIDLAASTTYFVHVDSSSGFSNHLQNTASNDEDSGGQSGWSIADGSVYRARAVTTVTWASHIQSKKIAIKGYAKTTTVTAPTVATVIPDQTATAATAFSYAFPATTFSDPDSDTLTYTATKADGTALPSWLSFSTSTRTFSGTPQAADVGTVSVKVTASDGSASVSDTFAIVVSAAPSTAHCNPMDTNELWCSSLTVGTVSVGTSSFYGYNIGFSYGALAPDTFDYRTATIGVGVLVYQGPQMRFVISHSSGTTPADGLLGPDTFTLEIGTGATKRSFSINNPGTDLDFRFSNHGLSWSSGDTIPVKLVRTNTAPTVATVIPDQTATAGTAFSYAFPATTFSDADSDTLTYTATQADGTALPSWLSFSASTRTFSGTPQAADVATVSVKVTASDGSASVSDTFDIVVSAAGDTTAPTLTSAVVNETGQLIQLQFSENVDRSNLPPASAVTVTAGASPLTITGVTVPPPAGGLDKYWVLVTPAIRQGQAVIVTYTDPTAGNDANAIQDTAGNDAASFTTGSDGVPAVTNGSTLTNTARRWQPSYRTRLRRRPQRSAMRFRPPRSATQTATR